jgi:flagellar motor switch protein FliG
MEITIGTKFKDLWKTEDFLPRFAKIAGQITEKMLAIILYDCSSKNRELVLSNCSCETIEKIAGEKLEITKEMSHVMQSKFMLFLYNGNVTE